MADSEDLAFAKKKIHLARLEEAEISPIIQSLSLQEEQDDLFLLQLNPELLSNLSEGRVLTIRGDSDDPAVICTQSSTFEMKEAETSNSLLLMPEMLWADDCQNEELKVVPQNVSGVFHTYFELRAFKPNFKKLRSLLEKSAYQGKEYDDDIRPEDKFTFDMLLDVIQSSEEELRAELVRMQTCTIDGFVRVLEFSYKFNVFSSIVNVIDSQSFPINKIPMKTVVEALEELEPRAILEEFFVWFSDNTGEIDESGCELHALKEDTVCKLYAEVLLRSSGKFHLQDFLDSWQKSVPEGMVCDLSQLRGTALTDLSRKPEVIFHFPVHNLSENIGERIEHLFKMKEKWLYDDIVPYLEDRVTPGSDVKALLIKYTRESTKDGKKMYSSKW